MNTKYLLTCALLLTLQTVYAQSTVPESPLIGNWRLTRTSVTNCMIREQNFSLPCENETICTFEFSDGERKSSFGESVTYWVDGDLMTVLDKDGTKEFKVQLRGNTLVLTSTATDQPGPGCKITEWYEKVEER